MINNYLSNFIIIYFRLYNFFFHKINKIITDNQIFDKVIDHDLMGHLHNCVILRNRLVSLFFFCLNYKKLIEFFYHVIIISIKKN